MEQHQARWIWSDLNDPAPKNRFIYFRKIVVLDELPKRAMVQFAADTNAQLWLNGHPLRRKVSRYTEEKITAEKVNAAPYLKKGPNVLVVQHNNWGDIVTFMRTGNKHAGLYIHSDWVVSDTSWKCCTAPEFQKHEDRIIGLNNNTPRIRYPVLMDGRKGLIEDLHEADFDDSDWAYAMVVQNGPWPDVPGEVETPGQREYPVYAFNVLAAGRMGNGLPIVENSYHVAQGILNAKLQPDAELTALSQRLTWKESVTLNGREGESFYVTLDFGFPVHGFPLLHLEDSTGGTYIDIGYCELYRALYDGAIHVREDGWINTEGVVGKGYADRYITRAGTQHAEIPEERTARWLTIHCYFTADTTLTFREVALIKSHYPLRLVGSFSCGLERMDQIVKLCQIHSEVTMTDAYIDTPGREDGQWIEDIRPRALVAERWYGDSQLRRLLIRTHAESQFPDGNMHPFAPSNFPMRAPYDWSVQWVASLYDDYMWSGSTEMIAKYWDVLVKYWEHVLSMVNEEGLWLTPHVLADIRIGVRCTTGNHSSGIVTPWIIERLDWSVTMAEAMQDTEHAEIWRDMVEKMTAAFRKYHVVPAHDNVPAHVGDRYDIQDPGNVRGYSQAGQTIAVTYGLLDKEEARKNLEYAFQAPDGTPPDGVTRWNNPTYFYRVLAAMTRVGMTEHAMNHLFERYANYLPVEPRNPTPLGYQGPMGGPLPEYWINREDLGLAEGEINTTQPDDETGSHGWAAVPLLWLHEFVLGISWREPGGGALRIAPDAMGLPFIAGNSMTPKGRVWVYWDPQQWRLEVELPEQVTAEIVIPEVCAHVLERCQVLEGVAERTAPGVYRVRRTGRVVFEIQ